MLTENPVFVALDTTKIEQAVFWANEVRPWVGGVKLGLEFFNSNGPDGVREIVNLGLPVFLDLKFHDIPNTVVRALNAVAELGIFMVNVHASGGGAMLQAVAKNIADMGSDRPLVVGVTVLTSLDESDLNAVGQSGPISSQVGRLARLTQTSGLDGVVCAPSEITELRKICGEKFYLVVPGIRPSWAHTGDQKRIMTPGKAKALGADIIVIGRPITESEDPALSAKIISNELDAV